ncbi:MAG: HD domain-containing protein [Thermomicrobia bacterium]|nr:HD domain-containing protein [Thermomicrobia bacterium]
MQEQDEQRAEISDGTQWEARFATFLVSNQGTEDAAHDTSHIQRVVANARLLAEAEGADRAVVLPAAWLHDCVIVPKDSPERTQASRLAAQAAGDFLRDAGYPARHIPAIEHAIAAHSFSARIAPQTREAQVVQDADRLDALGAIGIARTLMLGGAMGKPLYDAAEPFPTARTADDGENVLDHFFVKLLTLSETMQTRAGRAEAERRTAFMHDYLTHLAAEIGAGAPFTGT